MKECKHEWDEENIFCKNCFLEKKVYDLRKKGNKKKSFEERDEEMRQKYGCKICGKIIKENFKRHECQRKKTCETCKYHLLKKGKEELKKREEQLKQLPPETLLKIVRDEE